MIRHLKFSTVAAAAVLVAAAGGAHAQSSTTSVTLFGILDASARYVKNGDNDVKSLASGGASTSRLGFRGVEDLGGGLKASFWLETGLNTDTGTQSDATRFWNRRSTVSLLGNFGEIRLGRDFAPTYLGWSDFDVFTDNGIAAGGKFVPTSNALGTATDTNQRVDNQVQYFLPGGIGGLYGSVAVAAGEGSVGKKYYGGRVGYAAGPLNVSVGYGQTEVATNAVGDDQFKIGTFGASYDFGVAKLFGYYVQQKYSALKLEVASVGVTVPLGTGQLRAQYTDANASGGNIGANDAQQLAVGYVYDLSKRTSLYTTVAQVKNKGNAVFRLASTPTAPAGTDSTGAEFGIRHRF